MNVHAQPRVALFCETYNEINGVALTVRQLVDFAKRQDYPFLTVLSGPRVARHRSRNITHLELPRSWASFGIERDLRYDLFLWRHLDRVREALTEFRPDVVHVTSPGEFGQLGAYLARRMRIPLVASWHTNLHQFAARRLAKLLSPVSAEHSEHLGAWVERTSLLALLRFYRIAQIILAPTVGQVRWLEDATGRAAFLMPRGVDSEQFHPRFRTVNDGIFRVGYVGRLTPEKGVRFLADVEGALASTGNRNFSMLVVGDGSERAWLERNLRRATFTGILRGPYLSEAYANMDLFVFPSRTDTYGNVVQEAAASGVPTIVTADGGPKDLVASGVTGFVASGDSQFLRHVVEAAAEPMRVRQMGDAARKYVLDTSWDKAFEMTYWAYRLCQKSQEATFIGGPDNSSGKKLGRPGLRQNISDLQSVV
jgi:phosphatidylinositol alpha 1,6-mannosyltransferase